MFDCVIPAAGASSRMRGPEGTAVLKALLPFGGGCLVEASVAAALGAGCRVILVLGNRGGEVAAPFLAEPHRAAREGGSLLFADNPLWEEGLLGSIQAALSLVRGEAFFITLADMPFIGSGAYRLLAQHRSRLAPGIPCALHASHRGLRGHPVLLPSAWIPRMLALDRGGTMRSFLEGRPALLVETGSGALRDIDTPEEYLAATEVP